MVHNGNYVVIQGFMVNELKLKGNDLLVYAIIFGFSQSENQKFTGSLQYLADWTNSTKQGIQKNLKQLIDKGLIVKEDKTVNGVKFVSYYTTQLYGVCNSVSKSMQLSCTNNIDNNIDIKEEEEKENIINFYENNFGLITDYIIKNINTYLDDGLTEELIIEAMKEAVSNNARTWNYVKTILNNCLNNNVKTAKQYYAAQKEFKNKKTTSQPKKQEVNYNTDFSEYDEYARRE